MLPDTKDKIRGCLFGGAAGDALGYPVEFLSERSIVSEYGENGITDYIKDPESGEALISDDTQMTLFTANGILIRETRGELRGIAGKPADYVEKSYQDWLWTQEHNFGEQPEFSVSWLLDVPELFNRRAPGNTCLSALKNKKCVDNSKGCGGIMRVAPLGLVERGGINALTDSADIATITHGHSLGYIPAAIFGELIHRIVFMNKPLDEAVREAISEAQKVFGKDGHFDYLVSLLEKAVALSKNNLPDIENIHELGEGWVAEEALAIAVYCSLKYRDDFSKGIIAAVNHRGDSDSTGALTGNILGALLGYEEIDTKWKNDLELSDVILEIADDLFNGFSHDEGWMEKYVYCKK